MLPLYEAAALYQYREVLCWLGAGLLGIVFADADLRVCSVCSSSYLILDTNRSCCALVTLSAHCQPRLTTNQAMYAAPCPSGASVLGLARGTNGRYSSVQGPICLHLGMPLCHFISGDVGVLDRESAECEMAEVRLSCQDLSSGIS